MLFVDVFKLIIFLHATLLRDQVTIIYKVLIHGTNVQGHGFPSLLSPLHRSTTPHHPVVKFTVQRNPFHFSIVVLNFMLRRDPFHAPSTVPFLVLFPPFNLHRFVQQTGPHDVPHAHHHRRQRDSLVSIPSGDVVADVVAGWCGHGPFPPVNVVGRDG